ncbi:MAG: sensor histidine kinase [Planctomycetaceae bacterium]
MSEPTLRFTRYQELQRYVAWTADDARRVQELGPVIDGLLKGLIEDFYDEIQRHPDAQRVITGGVEQVARLKQTLIAWLRELFSGRYDESYVERRWRVGKRHVEIGLNQVYTNVALSRLRGGLVEISTRLWQGDREQLSQSMASLHKLLDLDLAIIEDAYQSEYLRRQQQVERLVTIGQVAGGIAHELRNPLNVIKTSVYYLLNAKHPTPEKVQSHLDRIQKQVDLADGVITALSNFARLPLPSMHPFSLAECIGKTLELAPLPPSIEVYCEGIDGLPAAVGDSAQFQIVFSNLIRNAREAMPEGGRLDIRADTDSSGIEVRVTDSGSGIPQELRDRIMEPLFTTKARGIGLGLAMARAIVEKNNGSLTVESEPGKGATFVVRLLVQIT